MSSARQVWMARACGAVAAAGAVIRRLRDLVVRKVAPRSDPGQRDLTNRPTGRHLPAGLPGKSHVPRTRASRHQVPGVPPSHHHPRSPAASGSSCPAMATRGPEPAPRGRPPWRRRLDPPARRDVPDRVLPSRGAISHAWQLAWASSIGRWVPRPHSGNPCLTELCRAGSGRD